MMPDNFREYAMSMVSYDPETGLFHWKVKRKGYGGGVWPGKVAGTRHVDGYNVINFSGKLWRAQRLAYLFQTGEVPAKGMEMDHINGDRFDNRWSNLRCVTKSQNMWNAKAPTTNVSGTKGVSWVAKRNKWLARLKVDGKIIHLGEHADKEDAIAARKAGELKYHGEFARKAA